MIFPLHRGVCRLILSFLGVVADGSCGLVWFLFFACLTFSFVRVMQYNPGLVWDILLNRNLSYAKVQNDLETYKSIVGFGKYLP